MLSRRVLLAAARSPQARRVVVGAPGGKAVVARFVAGEERADAVAAVDRLIARGLHVSLDHLGEDPEDDEHAAAITAEYVGLLAALDEAGLARRAEVSVKLSALGAGLGRSGDALAADRLRTVCAAAAAAGTTVTVDMEGHARTDATLATALALRADFPDLGVVLQAYLRRTEADCRELLGAGSRVRLVKGAYDEPEALAFKERVTVDRAYVRCLRLLMEGQGYPMIATHDPRLIEIAGRFAVRTGRPQESYEFQMLYGIREDEQRRLAAAGETVRVYVPYGTDWYAYFMRRLAERPANLAFFARALVGR
ncbi:proline dehydrogenase family protein [Streptacidiphilus rugosus]|uniref:proline dehydrogenase family protein n=1 Tax=Streptacidiphilus rugosus TaxID=405783 RepID=UPI00055F458F|nr:proline dehydrogenase family protein [Streptacidiphilus rugosus]